jgi:DHA1 family multidrug resistance protein-like MFS transporter
MKRTVEDAEQAGIISIFRENEAFTLLCVQVFVLHIGQNLITPILPLYAQKFAIGTTLVGFLIAIQGTARIFTNLPAGRLSDRIGANRLLAAAAWIATLAALVGGLAPSYTVLLLSRLTQGVASAISQTAGLTYTANISGPEKRGRYLSLFQGSFLLGNSIGPILGGFAAQYLGYRAPFYFFAILALLVGIWMWVRLPDPREQAAPAAVKESRPRPGFMISLRSMLSKPGVILVSFIGLSAAYTRAGSRNMAVPLLGADIGLSEGEIGLMLTIIFIATVIAVFLAGTLSDRIGPKRIITPSWMVLTLGMVVLALAPGYWSFVAGAIVFGLASGLSSPVPITYISNSVDEDSQGMALGLYRTFNDAGLIFGPIVMGWIADLRDISAGVMFNAGLVLFIAVMFFILAPPTEEEKLRRSQGESVPLK